MKRRTGGRYIPRGNKASADKRKAAMLKRIEEYRPKCLFVVDAEGRFCGKPTVDSHTIPKTSVLEPMMGPDKRVLVTSWGVGSYSHLFMSSSEERPIDLTPGNFKPQPQGINRASTGQFACHDHETNTFDLLDVADPDFSDPRVLFLTEYRTYLYAYSLLCWGKWLFDDWNLDIMRNGKGTQRAGWIKKRGEMRQILPHTSALVSQLGRLRFTEKESANVSPQWVSGRLLYFRSSLKFSACMFYGRSSAITVFPTDGDWHGLGMARLSDDEVNDDRLAIKLVEQVEVSRNLKGYSISVLSTLHDMAAGVVAMSPDSYDRLSNGEILGIREIIASIANADMLSDILNSVV